MNPEGAVHSLVLWADVLSTADALTEVRHQGTQVWSLLCRRAFLCRFCSD